MASHPSESHVDTGGETRPACPCVPERSICCRSLHKTSRDFSAIAIAQAHEQANGVIEPNGGATGVTEDPSALRGWMIAGPEVSQLFAQYEIASEAKETVVHKNHHEQIPKVQQYGHIP